MHKNKSKGFTLIELLLAITIFSIIATVIYSSFRLGVSSWRKIDQNLSRYQEIRYALNALTRDLKNTFRHSDIPFAGTGGSISFAGLIDSEEGKIIGKISYFSGETDPPSGASGLMRLEQDIPQLKAQEEEAEGEESQEVGQPEEQEEGELFLDGVIGFNIEYAYRPEEEETEEIEWRADWSVENIVPRGVKISITVGDESSAEGKLSICRRIYIPCGTFGGIEELEEAEETEESTE